MLDVCKYDNVLIGTNIYCTMGNGVQKDVAINYPYVSEMNMKTKYGDKSKLGTMIECEFHDEPKFTLLYITEGYNFRPDKHSEYLSYQALESCIKLANIKYEGLNVATTLLGCSKFDGNGNREIVFDMILDNVESFDLTIYDYLQLSCVEKYNLSKFNELAIKKDSLKRYYQAVSMRKKKELGIKERIDHFKQIFN